MMILEANQLVGKPLITVTEGRIIGKVEDIYVDSTINKVTAIRLGGGGMFSRKVSVVQRMDIEMFGHDAVFLKGSATPQEANQISEYEAWLIRDKLKNREMDTPGGTKLGTIGDLIISEKGQVLGFKFEQYFVQGTLTQYGSIIRQAVVEVANADGIMTINLSQAEQYKVGSTPSTESNQDVVAPVSMEKTDQLPEQMTEGGIE